MKSFQSSIDSIHPGFLLEKNLRGAKDNRPLFFEGQKTIDHCFLKTIDYYFY